MVQVMDATTVAELRDLMEDDFGDLLAVYLRDGEDRLSRLEAALRAGDGEAIRQAAHSLKGSSTNIGARWLSEACFQLELAGKAGDLNGCEPLLADVRLRWQKTADAVRALND